VNSDFGGDSVEDLVGVEDVPAATCTDQSIEDELAELADQVAEETSPAGAAKAGGGGARVFSVEGKIVLLTQGESYHHCGDFFVDFSPIEFECIVDVLSDGHIQEESRGNRRGRLARRGFPLARPTTGLYVRKCSRLCWGERHRQHGKILPGTEFVKKRRLGSIFVVVVHCLGLIWSYMGVQHVRAATTMRRLGSRVGTFA
jgi:hypothetical protein